MIAGAHYFRNEHAPELDWFCVLRSFQQSVGKRLCFYRKVLPDDAWYQPSDGVDNDERGEFSAGDHKITYGVLMSSQRSDSFVKSFIVPAKDCYVFFIRKSLCVCVNERLSLRSHEQNRRVCRSFYRFECREEGLRF